uniref:Spermatogenesis-associated protein 4 n=1 Tax=Astatotilapia calliptera TaxID=8154 RepID=A0AAX7SXM8_ASTCA
MARSSICFAECPKKTGLPREVVKWLQTLDLAFYPKNVRRDFSSGYLVAQIFSHYYPRDFSLHSYDRGTSLSAKQWNWSQIERSLEKRNLYLKKEAIDGTIHCKPGAAELLVLEVYTILTKGRYVGKGPEPDFTDEEYQNLLPSLARSTASKAIKNNLTATEIKAAPDISTNQRKAQNILRRHHEHKAAERILNPGRSSMIKCCTFDGCVSAVLELWSSPAWSRASVSFKEIKVRQPAKHSLVNY